MEDLQNVNEENRPRSFTKAQLVNDLSRSDLSKTANMAVASTGEM